MINFLFYLVLILAFYKILVNKIAKKTKKIKINSLPSYYGLCLLLWNLIILIFLYITKYFFNIAQLVDFNLLVYSSIIFTSACCLLFLKTKFRAREHFERIIFILLFICALSTLVITALIIITIFFQTYKFTQNIPIINFLLGTNWEPQNELINEIENSFGVIPVFTGTLLITGIAIIIAAPIGILSAIYLTNYSSKKTRKRIKPLIEVLAGIPTIVYGYFAATTVSPYIKKMGNILKIDISSESALGAGIVMGIMIIPYILSIVDDVIDSVPKSLRDAALALGFTKHEMIIKIILPSAMPGIYSAIILAISRAIGETMIVAMSAGLSAILTLNPLNSVTTVTAQIVSLLTGDQEFNSNKTLAAFALAFILFIITFILNIISKIIVEKYKKFHA